MQQPIKAKARKEGSGLWVGSQQIPLLFFIILIDFIFLNLIKVCFVM